MDTQYFKSFADINVKQIAPGYHSKLIHTGTNTLNFIDVDKGAIVKPHQHIHEQMSFVLEGEFELTIDGEAQILDAGTFAIIPSNVVHSGRAITNCKLLDVFSPVREDYKNL
ncbi:cupin domain-containing protein [Mucilaginibacter ginkgonis]|uniref:Cupin domain-containing protein n=1 Tax=Mucilaginibacter ginkgonis TaxID=2682091 RepID=A0A6I4HVK0_9SPHI|nr:cupin domain-containing protein [Mucilaginibacter ginkgonis]QQL50355.1 cupin domain-containing protein [Mucilaginibacter ginkgonis]